MYIPGPGTWNNGNRAGGGSASLVEIYESGRWISFLLCHILNGTWVLVRMCVCAARSALPASVSGVLGPAKKDFFKPRLQERGTGGFPMHRRPRIVQRQSRSTCTLPQHLKKKKNFLRLTRGRLPSPAAVPNPGPTPNMPDPFLSHHNTWMGRAAVLVRKISTEFGFRLCNVRPERLMREVLLSSSALAHLDIGAIRNTHHTALVGPLRCH